MILYISRGSKFARRLNLDIKSILKLYFSYLPLNNIFEDYRLIIMKNYKPIIVLELISNLNFDFPRLSPITIIFSYHLFT